MKSILPGWEIVEKIGAGGFSTVYKIKKCDSVGDREYYAALKVIKIPNSSDEYDNYIQEGFDDETITTIFTNQVKKMEEEFHLMSRFKGNSNIVSYEDHMIVPHEDGKGWDILIRMELLEPLTKYCNKTPLNVEEIVKLGIDICRALELCKKENIIHRDIKPQNIFVNKYGDYKLGDFGIAKTMDHATHATRTGTYTYMAPEVYHGEAYDSSVDIYSLGLVLYWLLNERRLPFLPLPPVAPTATQMNESSSRRIAGEKIPAPQNGSEELKQIVLKACAFKAEERYTSAIEMKEDLEEVLLSLKANTRKNRKESFSPSYDSIRDTEDEKTLILEPDSVEKKSQNNVFDTLDDVSDEKNKNVINSESKNKSDIKYSSGSTKSKPLKVLKTVLLLEIFAAVVVIAAIICFFLFVFNQCSKEYEVGDVIIFGKYEQDNIISNGAEDIEWEVLEVRDGKALIISKYGIDIKPYNETYTCVTWETCTLRTWLNKEFYSTTFTSKERAKIESTYLINYDPIYDLGGGNDTTDKVFLLSYSEAEMYFSSYLERVSDVTEYVEATREYELQMNDNWWLRSSFINEYGEQYYAAVVDHCGNVEQLGEEVDTFSIVRPAIWISLE